MSATLVVLLGGLLLVRFAVLLVPFAEQRAAPAERRRMGHAGLFEFLAGWWPPLGQLSFVDDLSASWPVGRGVIAHSHWYCRLSYGGVSTEPPAISQSHSTPSRLGPN